MLSLASGVLAMGGGGGMGGGMVGAGGSTMSGNMGNMNNQGNMDPNRMNQQNMGNQGNMGMNNQGQIPPDLDAQWQPRQYGKWPYESRQPEERETATIKRSVGPRVIKPLDTLG